MVLIGDCGVARLNKDGIGSAYRTARAAEIGLSWGRFFIGLKENVNLIISVDVNLIL